MKKKTQKPIKSRDPFVQHLIGKKQGAHSKSKKAQRRDDKAQLKKETFDKAAAFSKVFC